VTRRVLAAIPPSSQVLCASPYLDANLFQYDEKHISPTIRPRALAEVHTCARNVLQLHTSSV
jgi:De-etiolated protein 1 Det1